LLHDLSLSFAAQQALVTGCQSKNRNIFLYPKYHSSKIFRQALEKK
jgi:hypothetical protein